MKQLNLPNFDTACSTLESAGLKIHPSHLHGLITGVVVGGQEQLSGQAIQAMIAAGEDLTEVQGLIQEMIAVVNQQLEDFLFEVTLMLPDDDAKLSSRAEGLTVWCQGFLTGLKCVNVAVTSLDGAASEVKEAVGDLFEISKMNYEEVIATEEDEEAYVELVEYVRMSVILLFQEWHEGVSAELNNESSHHLH